ncbi:hypothetical protein FJT64_006741 [Amphibalanus amphitrite]|uniref:Uncharacterized protein n=1 Tax=Amphibalanus amphitrite TaxID=1232801 RepID=A0A6A4W1S9_AMPAM|nr:hypothetical protein FJT64_006741 [Amphibalanus amphitrite]
MEALPDSIVAELSRDQEQLYLLARAVQNGSIAETVAFKRLGALNHASIWSEIMAHVVRCEPQTIAQLNTVVKDFTCYRRGSLL